MLSVKQFIMDKVMDNTFLRISLLNLPGWGNASVRKLLGQYDSNELQHENSVSNAIQKLAVTNKRIKVPVLADIKMAFSSAEDILKLCSKHDIEILTPDSKGYPKRLLKIKQLQPIVLFAKGETEVLNSDQIIALIGTRKPDDWIYQSMKRIGLRCAEKDIVVLSGLAIGCDTAAHEGCLEVGGKAIGVLGNGLDTIYPKASQSLAASILSNGGCLISEYPPKTKMNKYQLVVRDKLQAAMSDKVIVGQTTVEGGSMHAAKHSLDKLSRPVGVITGSRCIDESFSGNNELINLGAVSLQDNSDLKKFIDKKSFVKKAILFDLDQTLIDSSKLENDRKNRDWNKVLSSLHLIEPIKGVNSFLDQLKNDSLKVGLVTSSPGHYASAVCQKFGWKFDVMISYHDTSNHKPHPEPLEKAATLLDVEPSHCVYIGDHENDFLAAERAGMDFIYLLADKVNGDIESCLALER
jgi:DNA processing protein